MSITTAIVAVFERRRNTQQQLGGGIVARIVKTRDGWRACRPSEVSQIGTAISPIGMNSYRKVRDWLLKELED